MAPDSRPLSPEEFSEWWETTGEYELHQVLYWRWDPIGVATEYPYAAEEYDQYPPEIVAALSQGVSDGELVTLLQGFERENMGLSRKDGVERLHAVAALIRAWFERSQSSWREFGPLRR